MIGLKLWRRKRVPVVVYFGFAAFLVNIQAGQPGSVDLSFDAGAGATGANIFVTPEVSSAVRLPAGDMYVAGNFVAFNSHPTLTVARLFSSGGVDTNFLAFRTSSILTNLLSSQVIQATSNSVFVVYIDKSGTIQTRDHLVRLLADGSVDTNFISEKGSFRGFAVQADGKILVSGFSLPNTPTSTRLIRLNADGTYDNSFTPYTSPTINLRKIRLLPDGKILVKTAQSNPDQTLKTGLLRFFKGGEIDPSFQWPENLGLAADDFEVQSDGRIVIARTDSPGVRLLARLNPDGGLDSDFNPDLLDATKVNAVAIQPNGQILAAVFTPNRSDGRYHQIMRFGPNGSRDPEFIFVPVLLGYPTIRVVTLQPDGQILLAGSLEDAPSGRRTVLRVNGTSDRWLVEPNLNQNNFKASLWTNPGKRYSLEQRVGVANSEWGTVQTIDGDGTRMTFSHQNTGAGVFVYRLRIE